MKLFLLFRPLGSLSRCQERSRAFGSSFAARECQRDVAAVIWTIDLSGFFFVEERNRIQNSAEVCRGCIVCL